MKGYVYTCFPATASSAYAMYIVLDLTRHVEVDHMLFRINISRYENIEVNIFETIFTEIV